MLTKNKKPNVHFRYLTIMGLTGLMGLGAACSSMPTSSSDADLSSAATGPSVVYARSEPGTIELNRKFQPKQTAEVLADVKDFTSKISSVKLQFTNIPLEIPMENIGGSTWRAQLTPRQLEMLAVSGRTAKYEANVIAKNKEGKTAMTAKPVEVAVKTPSLSTEATSG